MHRYAVDLPAGDKENARMALEKLYKEGWLSDATRTAITTYRHRRRHVHCVGMGVPVLKTTTSPRR